MPSLAYLAKLDGGLALTETSAITILDTEAASALRKGAQLGRRRIREAAPTRTRTLQRSHGYSVRRSAHGHIAHMTRRSSGWYGRIVETGRDAGWSPGHSARTRRPEGWHYPAAKANPYVDEAAAKSLYEVEQVLMAGGVHGADRIARELLRAV